MTSGVPAQAQRLLNFIASKEAPRGYETVFGNKMARMPKPLTSMTLDEAIADGPRRTREFGSSACGRYQFMAATLKNLRKAMSLTGREVMNPAFQDTLGFKLLSDRGYARFMAGSLSVVGFGLNIAKEWASFPVLADTQGQHRRVKRGQSYYTGDALNKSLISADEVQRFLTGMRSAASFAPAFTTAQPALEPVLSAPHVETVVAPTRAEAKADLPFWARWFVKKTKADPISRPGLKPGGSAELYDVQCQLRARSYYTKMRPDGLDGPITQAAVAQARKDNGLGDGGVDQAFLATLPGMPNRLVPVEKATASLGQAAKQLPEVFNPLKWIGAAALTSVAGGTADGTGLLDQLQSTTSRVNDVAGSVQSAFGAVTGVVGFIAEHRSLALVAVGLIALVYVANKALDAWIKFRTAFF